MFRVSLSPPRRCFAPHLGPIRALVVPAKAFVNGRGRPCALLAFTGLCSDPHFDGSYHLDDDVAARLESSPLQPLSLAIAHLL